MKKILICGLLLITAGCAVDDASGAAILICRHHGDDRAVLTFDKADNGYFYLTHADCTAKNRDPG